MTDITDKNNNTPFNLPQIQPKHQNSQSESDQPQNAQNTNNIQPLTHKKKKKRHHKKKVRKHSPQYYQQKKIQKLNKIREQNWNSHFINESIPNILDKRKAKTKRLLSRQYEQRRSLAHIDKEFSNKTVAIGVKRITQLPTVDKKHQTTKSFKIRIVNQNNTQKAPYTDQIVNKAQTTNKTHKISSKTQKSRPKRKSQAKNNVENITLLKQQYEKKLKDLIQQAKFLNCHKQVLEYFFPLLYNKGIRQMLDKQFNNIKMNKSLITKVTKSIQNRQNELSKLKQALKNSTQNVQKPQYQLLDNYRTATLSCIEEILKWKQNWQNTYFQVFNKQITFDLIYKVENYLITIMKSGDEIIKMQNNTRKNNQIQEKKNQKNSIEPNTNIQTKTQQPNKNLIQKYQQDNKNKKQICDTIQSNDPFLITLCGLEIENKEIILKIRACQLLLLEEEFNFRKK